MKKVQTDFRNGMAVWGILHYIQKRAKSQPFNLGQNIEKKFKKYLGQEIENVELVS